VGIECRSGALGVWPIQGHLPRFSLIALRFAPTASVCGRRSRASGSTPVISLPERSRWLRRTQKPVVAYRVKSLHLGCTEAKSIMIMADLTVPSARGARHRQVAGLARQTTGQGDGCQATARSADAFEQVVGARRSYSWRMCDGV
jgi:hypothetical protein